MDAPDNIAMINEATEELARCCPAFEDMGECKVLILDCPNQLSSCFDVKVLVPDGAVACIVDLHH
jgi:hypothetical protein